MFKLYKKVFKVTRSDIVYTSYNLYITRMTMNYRIKILKEKGYCPDTV